MKGFQSLHHLSKNIVCSLKMRIGLFTINFHPIVLVICLHLLTTFGNIKVNRSTGWMSAFFKCINLHLTINHYRYEHRNNSWFKCVSFSETYMEIFRTTLELLDIHQSKKELLLFKSMPITVTIKNGSSFFMVMFLYTYK